jgi:hypothetical protein
MFTLLMLLTSILGSWTCGIKMIAFHSAPSLSICCFNAGLKSCVSDDGLSGLRCTSVVFYTRRLGFIASRIVHPFFYKGGEAGLSAFSFNVKGHPIIYRGARSYSLTGRACVGNPLY